VKKSNVKYLARVFALLAVLRLVLPPSAALAASIGTSADITQTNAVYFGAYEQDDPADGKDPIEWRVLENSGGELFLLSEKNLDAKPYHEDDESVTWERSTIRSWLNGYGASENKGDVVNPANDSGIDYSADSFIGAAFSAAEKNAIPAAQAHTYTYNSDTAEQTGSPTSDQIFLMSVREVTSAALGFPAGTDSDGSRVAINTAYAIAISRGAVDFSGNGGWWLRSPGYDVSIAAFVDDHGGAYPDGNIVYSASVGVRPAFKLNLSSVILISAASGGKSPSLISSNLEPASVSDAGGMVKLTLQTSAQTLEVTAAAKQSTQSGGTLSFAYKNATTGANQFVSCVMDQGGAVKYYGKLADSSGTAGGTLAIPLTGVANGTYTLKIFSEQDNGDNHTDFASAPVLMTVTVAGNIGAVSNFGGAI
jgi:hypothetical protein